MNGMNVRLNIFWSGNEILCLSLCRSDSLWLKNSEGSYSLVRTSSPPSKVVRIIEDILRCMFIIISCISSSVKYYVYVCAWRFCTSNLWFGCFESPSVEEGTNLCYFKDIMLWYSFLSLWYKYRLIGFGYKILRGLRYTSVTDKSSSHFSAQLSKKLMTRFYHIYRSLSVRC